MLNVKKRDYMYLHPPHEAHAPKIEFAALASLVCEGFGVTPALLYGQRRQRHIAQARKCLWFLAREFTSLSLPQLGRMTGGRDHTTVLHGLQSFHKDCERYPVFREKAERVYALVRGLSVDEPRL